jgi:uncharacterized protein with PQ loop repeat
VVSVFEIFGIVGIAISMLAYIPQVVHLVRKHCSAGVSGRVVSGVLVGALALHRRDPVFIMLQVSNLTSTAAIAFLAYRYRSRVCDQHVDAIRSGKRAVVRT